MEGTTTENTKIEVAGFTLKSQGKVKNVDTLIQAVVSGNLPSLESKLNLEAKMNGLEAKANLEISFDNPKFNFNFGSSIDGDITEILGKSNFSSKYPN